MVSWSSWSVVSDVSSVVSDVSSWSVVSDVSSWSVVSEGSSWSVVSDVSSWSVGSSWSVVSEGSSWSVVSEGSSWSVVSEGSSWSVVSEGSSLLMRDSDVMSIFMRDSYFQVLGETRYKNILPLFKGCTAIAYSKESHPVSNLVSATQSESKLHMLGGIMDDQMFTPRELQECAELPPLLTQHMILSRSLTLLQSSLRDSLLHNQKQLSGLIKRIPEK